MPLTFRFECLRKASDAIAVVCEVRAEPYTAVDEHSTTYPVSRDEFAALDPRARYVYSYRGSSERTTTIDVFATGATFLPTLQRAFAAQANVQPTSATFSLDYLHRLPDTSSFIACHRVNGYKSGLCKDSKDAVVRRLV